MSLQRYRDLVKEAESSVEYWTEVAVNDFARELHELMNRRNVSSAELARRLGVERQYISKLLGGANVTLQTMVKLAMALDGVVRVRLEQRGGRQVDAGVVVEFAPGEPALVSEEPEVKTPKRRRGQASGAVHRAGGETRAPKAVS